MRGAADTAGTGAQDAAAPRFYLPDFCAPVRVLAVVLIAELVAILLTLGRYGIGAGFWPDLARTSLFLLWVGLGTAAILCALRPRLSALDVRRGSLLALGVVLGVTALVTEVAWWFSGAAGRLLGVVRQEPGAGHALFLLRNLFIGTIAGGLALRYFYVSQQWKRNVEAEASARVRALQARIRPHFLFNSMNTIASLTRSDPALAEEAVTDLADLFRASLRESNERIPLADEIAVAQTYARIEGLRLGPRLRVEWQVDDLPGDALVPALVLQPLVENAVYHGVEPLAGGGVVTVRGRREGRFVSLVVENPVDSARPRLAAGSGIGLDNVRQRLDLMFPGEGSLAVRREDGRFVATLRFPASGAER
jgi:two-component system sensor histidine kinase AlgZ